jgi:hypothetical protein
MSATLTEPGVDDLTQFEFGIPCQSDVHDTKGTGDAVWLLIFRVPFPCGCAEHEPSLAVCDGCLAEARRLGLWLRCGGRPYRATFAEGVARCVPISRPTV